MEGKIVVVSSKSYENATNIQLLNIEYLNTSVGIEGFEALIITSKNSINALEALNIEWKQKDLYLISDESANLAKKAGGNVIYISKSGDAQGFAKELVNLLKQKKALFVRGESVVYDMHSYLKAQNIDISEAIIYKSECVKPANLKLPEEARYFIFGSPKCVECFLKFFSWSHHFVAVSLGKSTASAFPKEFNYIISPYKSIQKTIDFLGEM